MTERRRPHLAAFAASILAVAVAYGAAFLPAGAPPWAPWLMAVGIAGALASVMALGAAREGGLGPLGPVFLFVFVVVAGGFAAALLLEDAGAGTALWLGLPPPAAVVLYGVGLLPLVLVPAAYALTFERLTLSDEEWAEVRAAARSESGRGEAGIASGREAGAGDAGVVPSRDPADAGTGGGP